MEVDKRRLRSVTGSTLEPLEKHVYQQLKALRPLLEGQTIVVGVSGGVDSVVLLNVLYKLKERLKLKLTVCHINHALRGSQSDADSRFVAAMAKRLKLPVDSKKLRGVSLLAGEDLLRKERYKALFLFKKKRQAAFIATAHHRDDLLETRLIRLLQGTGIMGLKAMNLLSEEGVLRPFLQSTRREIEDYAQKQKIGWRQDDSNLDTTKLRNWVRRHWLGILRRDHPEYISNLFEGLERIIRATKPDENYRANSEIYKVLRKHGKKRVTHQHVAELRKRLETSSKPFVLRLAGLNWEITPLKPS